MHVWGDFIIKNECLGVFIVTNHFYNKKARPRDMTFELREIGVQWLVSPGWEQTLRSPVIHVGSMTEQQIQ